MGRRPECKPCRSQLRKSRYDPVRQRSINLRSSFGITVWEYEEMLTKQGGGCAICGVKTQASGRALPVDHDHNTGLIRGILCGNCNSGLGHFRDNPDFLGRAIQYLENSPASP